MKTKSYLILCAVTTMALVPALLYIPAFSDLVEQLMLLFLSTNAN